jgi:para-nitrobenzyl esterase
VNLLPLVLIAAAAAASPEAPTVRVDTGALRGTLLAGGAVRGFLGIPYAAPPTGDRRWSPPQPAAPWTGVRAATAFGARCVQARVYDDMVFRDEAGEDCLYLNVWTPARAERLPVMVWIHGGGFVAGSTSEPRQEGTRLAQKGVVVVSLNYRLDVFGFLAHPELTAERGASGNYGLMDMVAALAWVKKNAAGFGGDPGNVTIFGESAGSLAVSALMASPLAQGLFHKAIGESGAFFADGLPDDAMRTPSRATSEALGLELQKAAGATSLAGLRKVPAETVLKAARSFAGTREFQPTLDGVVLPRPVRDVFADGKQSRVPLLAGWNADELRFVVTLLSPARPTRAGFEEQVRKWFGAGADPVLAAYAPRSDEDAVDAFAEIVSDLHFGVPTWRFIESHARTSGAVVYRYRFDREIPLPDGKTFLGRPATAQDVAARHAGEIEYVFGALDSLTGAAWEPADRALSERMMSYWTNFARTGDPNGPELPKWPVYREADGFRVLHLDASSQAAPDASRARFLAIERLAATAQETAP